MADSIDPRPKPRPAIKPPLPPDLLAAATGATQLPPGVTGRPPIPVGATVTRTLNTPSGQKLSDDERAALEEVGFDYSVDLPTTDAGRQQVAAAIAKAKEAASLPPERLPGKPVGIPTVGKLEDLTPAKQNEFMEAIKQIRTNEITAAKQQADTQRAMSAEAAVPGVSQAVRAASVAAEKFAAEANLPLARAAAPAPATPAPAAPAAASAPPQGPPWTAPVEAPAPAAPQASETGANPHPINCPHCEWPLAIADIPEPEYAEKMLYLQYMLGRKLFCKDYSLFGGTVSVTFRTLAPKELDVVQRQAYFIAAGGQVHTERDFYELVNRYRFMLQLASVSLSGPEGTRRDLPDGYSHSTNPHATGVWLTEEREQAMLLENTTELPVIEEWLFKNVVVSEELFKALMFAFRQFNRLVAKYVAMADSQSFWQPTGGRP